MKNGQIAKDRRKQEEALIAEAKLIAGGISLEVT
jgi:hypothetical protein